MRRADVRLGRLYVFTPRRVDVDRIRARYGTRCEVVATNPLTIRFDDGDVWSIHHKSLSAAPTERSDQ